MIKKVSAAEALKEYKKRRQQQNEEKPVVTGSTRTAGRSDRKGLTVSRDLVDKVSEDTPSAGDLYRSQQAKSRADLESMLGRRRSIFDDRPLPKRPEPMKVSGDLVNRVAKNADNSTADITKYYSRYGSDNGYSPERQRLLTGIAQEAAEEHVRDQALKQLANREREKRGIDQNTISEQALSQIKNMQNGDGTKLTGEKLDASPIHQDDMRNTREYQFARRHPYAAGAVSTFTYPISGVEGLVNVGRQALNPEKMDANQLKGAILQDSLRQGIQRGIKDDLSKNPEFRHLGFNDDGKESFAEGFSDFIVGTTMDAINSRVGGAMLGPANAYALAGNAAQSRLLEGIQDDKQSRNQALATSVAFGIAEKVFEDVSYEHYIHNNLSPKTFRDILNNGLKSTFVEGSEEVHTDLANYITDGLINGENSEVGRVYNDRLLRGDTPAQALGSVILYCAKNMGLSFAGGGLSGGVSAVVGSAQGAYMNRQYDKAMEQYKNQYMSDASDISTILADSELNELNEQRDMGVQFNLDEIQGPKPRYTYEFNADPVANNRDSVNDIVNEAVDTLMQDRDTDTSESTPEEAKKLTQQAIDTINQQDLEKKSQEVETQPQERETVNKELETKRETQEPLIVDQEQEEPVEQSSTDVSQETLEPETKRVSSDELRDRLKSFSDFTSDGIKYEIRGNDRLGYTGSLRNISRDTDMVEDARATKYTSDKKKTYDEAVDDLVNVARNSGFTSDTVNPNNRLEQIAEDDLSEKTEPAAGELNGKESFDKELERRSSARFPNDPNARTFYNAYFEDFQDKIGVDADPMTIISSYDSNMAKAYEAGLNGAPISSLHNDESFRNFDELFPNISQSMYELGYNKGVENRHTGGNENAENIDTIREQERRPDEQGVLGDDGEVLHGGTGEQTGTGTLRDGTSEGDGGVHTEEGAGVRNTGDTVRSGNDNRGTDAGRLRESSGHGDAGLSGDGVSERDKVSDNERGSVEEGTEPDTGREQLTEKAPLEPKTPEERIDKEDDIATQDMPKGNNFVMTPDFIKSIPSTSAKRRDANIAAIKTLKNILSENRIATPEEQEILAKYTGWGGVSSGKNGDWQKAENALKGILTEEELDTARHSLEDAYFTSPDIIHAMYNGLSSIGFTGGRILEPSSGTGRFIGSMPEQMIPSVTRMTAVEIDNISGQIARLLYPNADIRIQGFQDANILSNFNDVVIGNVPFGKMNFIDNRYSKYPRLEHYFVERSIDATRPGGICALITAHTAIDGGRDANSAMDLKFRENIMKKADLIGAIRLPDNAFGITGTEVVSDILVFKKRKSGDPYMGESFKTSQSLYKDGVYTNVNEYFKDHPEMILGKYEIASTGKNGPHWTVTAKKGSLQQQIEKAFKNITARMEYDKKSDLEAVREANREARNNKKGTGYIKDGVLYKNDNGAEVKVDLKEDKLSKYKMAMEIRDTARSLIEAMSEGKDVTALRKQLNDQYDAFYKATSSKDQAGGFHRKYISEMLAKDTDYAFLKSLERVSTKDGKTVVEKAPIFYRNTVNAPVEITHVESLPEGIDVSMGKEGYIKPSYIAKLMNKSLEEVEKELDSGDLAYRDADNNFVPANIYLSGNVRAKLKEAETLAETDKKYKKNVEALKKVVPSFVRGEDIRVHLGANWIPEEYYSQFATELMKPKNPRDRVQIHYVRGAGYNVDSSGLFWNSENTNVWGTKAMPFLYKSQNEPGLLWKVLNNYNLEVKYSEEYTDEDGNTKKRTKHNLQEEAALRDIKRKLTNEFNQWLWKDDTRREHLETLFNDRYNSNAEAHYESDVTIPGQSPMITLMDHQKRLVNRVVQSPYNTLVQHGVGAGKTFGSIASLMKMKQLGMISKPVIVVPKNKISDWQNDFYTLFPNANILVADSFTFKKNYRKEFVNRMATNDVDAVIISYEQFKDIPMSPEKRLEYNRKELAKIMESATDEGATMDENGKFVFKQSSKTTRQLEQLKDRLKTEIAELENFKKSDDNIFFEQTGIDYICVDEAQNYKNLMYFTNLTGVADMGTPRGSQRAKDMKIKTDYIRNMQKGKGVMFLTATPIMNSPVEAYTMLRFLADEELEKMGINTLDDFISMFGEIEDITRQDNAGRKWTTKTSFTGFCNLQQWQSLWKTYVDRVKTEDIPGIRLPKVVETVIECQAGPVAREKINGLSERLEHVSREGENHVFAIQSDGKKASFTQRFFNESLPYGPKEKVVVAVDEIFKEWQDTKTFKDWDGNIQKNGVQLCFCDFGTPKDGEKETDEDSDEDDKIYNPNDENEKIMRGNLNIYKDMKDMLVKKGIPASEIAFIQDYKSDETKAAKLYDDVKAGRVRILFGSTKTMGEGLNIQDRITCMNMMNPFMRPGDREQAVGRGQRNHNMNPEVKVKIYVTLDTFDTKQWDNTNLKGRFINQIQDGTYEGNTANIEYSDTMSAADIMAVASGNPLLKTQTETNKKIEDLNLLKESYYQKQSNIRRDIENRNRQKVSGEEFIENVKKDIKVLTDISKDNFKAKLAGKIYDDREKFGEAVIKLANKAYNDFSEKEESERTPRTLGSIAGLSIVADGEILNGKILLKGNATYEVNIPLNDAKPAGVTTRFQNVIKGIPGELKNAEERTKNAAVEIEKLNQELKKPFEQQKKLDEFQNLAEEIEIALKENDSERFDELNNKFKELKSSDVAYSVSKKKGEVSNSASRPTRRENAERNKALKDEREKKAKDFQDSLRPDKWTAEKNEGSTAETGNLEELIGKFSHDMGFQYTPGKRYTKGKDVGGTYNYSNKGIRTKVANDLPSMSHEIGHMLMDRHDVNNQTIPSIAKEYPGLIDDIKKAYGAEYEDGDYPSDKVWGEGLAEFVRHYCENKDTARIDYPVLTDYFLKMLSPKELVLVDDFADKVNAVYAEGADKITQDVVLKEKSMGDYRTLGEKAHDYYVWSQIQAVDSNYGFKDVDLTYGTNLHELATNREYIDGKIAYALEDELRDLNGNYLGAGLRRCLIGVDLRPNSKEFTDFGNYLVVRHAPERLALGLRTYADDRQNNVKWMKERQAELEEKYPHFKHAAENLDRFQRLLLENYALKYGLISEDSYKKMLEDYPHYVPFFRAGFKNKGDALKKAKGSGRTIINPVDNIITSTVKLMNAASQQAIKLEMRNAAIDNDIDALFIEKIPDPQVAQKFDMRGIKEKLHNKIADIDVSRGVDPEAQDLLHDMVDNIENTLVQFQTGRARRDLNEITIMVDGKPEFWKVNDENLYLTLTSMDHRSANFLVNLYGKLTRFMTSNTTGNNFIWSIFSNSPRDFQTLLNYSDSKNVFKLAKLIGDSYIQSTRKAFGASVSDYYSEFLSMGAKGSPVWVGSERYNKDMRKLVSTNKGFDPSFLNPFKYFRFISETIEMGPRYATYRLLRERGMNAQKAFYEAMDITTNFRKKGIVGKELNKTVQFFNANVQGLDHAIRYYSAEDLKGKPKAVRNKAIRARMTFLVATSLLTAVLHYAANHRDDDDKEQYNMLSNYIKNYYFTIPMGEGKFFSIPKNHELSVLESLFERALEYYRDDNEVAFDEYFDYFAEQVFPPIFSEIAELPVHAATKGNQAALEDLGIGLAANTGVYGVLMQTAMNKNYMGSPIVPKSFEKLAPRQQYNKKTSQAAYLIGQALDISPMKFDHFMDNVFGYIWDYQKALFPIDAGDVKGEVDPWFGVKNKYIRDNLYSNNVSNRIYNKAEDSSMRYESYGDNLLEASLDEYMKNRYSKFTGLQKNEEETEEWRKDKREVLNELTDYLKGKSRNDLSMVSSLVEETGDKTYLPTALSTTFKNGKGGEDISLTSSEYKEMQDRYEDLYLKYMNESIDKSESPEKWNLTKTKAEDAAKSQAMDEMLKKKGIESNISSKAYDFVSSTGDFDMYADAAYDIGNIKDKYTDKKEKQQRVADYIRRETKSSSARKKLWELANYKVSEGSYYKFFNK